MTKESDNLLYQCLFMLMDAEYGTGVDENGIGSWGALLLGLAFIVAILGYFIYCIVNERLTCTVPVQAVCVDYHTSHSSDGMTYAPVWEYEFQGRLIRTHGSIHSSSMGKLLGQTRTLYINPDNPEKFREDMKSYAVFLVVCGIFLVFIVGAMIVKARNS